MNSIPTVEEIAGELNLWLATEIVNADGGRNHYLSDFQDRRNDLFKSFDDPTNFQSQKAKSHYDRFFQWVNPYTEDDFRYDDWFAARLTFASLMEISGSYRKQCFLEAADEQDYLKRRYGRPIGIDMDEVVRKELDPIRLEATFELNEEERLRQIVNRSHDVNNKSLVLHKLLHTWAIAHPKDSGSIASGEAKPIVAMKDAQRMWAGLAVAHIVVAASFRDSDFGAVPLLEPKSITDVSQILYPFAA